MKKIVVFHIALPGEKTAIDFVKALEAAKNVTGYLSTDEAVIQPLIDEIKDAYQIQGVPNATNE